MQDDLDPALAMKIAENLEKFFSRSAYMRPPHTNTRNDIQY